MAFTVEDGTGIDEANALIEVAFADEYFTDRGNTTWDNATEAAKQVAIIKATDYFNIRFFDRLKGHLSAKATTQAFPRLYMYDRKGEVVEGIPEDIKKAIAEYAVRSLEQDLMPDPETDPSGQSVVRKFEKLGPIEEETEFSAGSVQNRIKPYPAADRMIKFWLTGTGGVIR